MSSETERDRAARLLAEGRSLDEVRALVDTDVDLNDPAFLRLVEWHRQAEDGARRLTPSYLAVRAMALVDETRDDPTDPKKQVPALDATARAKLLGQVARLKRA